ncbi:MAG: RIP metalloprotease RseP [Flavobacterium sp. MedPE-SWcel]|uniref:RIP metalloprotease RseP n=1 Tax=uncultured Flavobacterium sp. TaxID=165435 RepID=UPI00090EDC47|nr:RIP metalloprotease RseP [uncultured Flavobacterium sp.]OIQ19319.1 MAG: RIP metalloprotease RseP [Flavobacterium sp. MedPE-SWcel]
MDTLTQIAQLVLMLSILVVLHEFGHYIAAKIFKVRVEKFYLFMDAKFALFKKKIGETEWGIGWLPLGGYVKLSGMVDESMDTDQMASEPQPWEFRSKPAWQRLIIMLGGIIVNILLAWFIYTVVYSTYGKNYVATEKIQENGLAFGETGKHVGFENGDKILSVDGKYQERFDRMVLDILLGDNVTIERDGKEMNIALTDENKNEILDKEGKGFITARMAHTAVDSVMPNSAAEKAGLMKGDMLKGVNGVDMVYFDEISDAIGANKGKAVVLNVERDGVAMALNATVTDEGRLGFVRTTADKPKYLINEKYSFFSAIPKAMEESYFLLVYNAKQFKLILRPSTGAYKHVKSPVGIATLMPTTWDWEFFWRFTALFSIGLAFMNLLPIPGLDGGHVVLTLIEMVTGRKFGHKTEEIIQTVGMVILLTLMALVFGKDIYQLIAAKFF